MHLEFKPEVFRAVSKALDEGRPADEIEPMLKKAEEKYSFAPKKFWWRYKMKLLNF